MCEFGILVRSLVEKHQLRNLKVDGDNFKIYLRVDDWSSGVRGVVQWPLLVNVVMDLWVP